MRKLIKDNCCLQRFKATLPDIVQNDKSLLKEISEILPDTISGDENKWSKWENGIANSPHSALGKEKDE
jgi:hypothetical protein